KERAFGPEQPDASRGQRLCGRLLQEVEDVPAQDAVHRAGSLREPGLEELRQVGNRALLDVRLDIRRDILDADAAAELLAEEVDVAPHDGPEIEQDGTLASLQGGQELLQCLGGLGRFGLGGGTGLRRRLTSGRTAVPEDRSEEHT